MTDSRPSEPTCDLDAYGMAATLDFELEAKQELLELRSEAERLVRLRALFDKALKRIDHAETAAEQARSNGKVKRSSVLARPMPGCAPGSSSSTTR